MKKMIAAAALAASLLLPGTASAATTLVNNGFEAGPTGNVVPTGWFSNRPANVSVVNNIFGYNPVEGNNFAVITSGVINLATTLFQQFDMDAGDIVRFAVAFYTEETAPTGFNDNGTLGIFDLDFGLGSTILFSQSVNTTVGNGTPWTFVSFTAPTTGSYQVTARIANIGDSIVPSYILLDAVDAVPEPGTWMLMLLGFGAIGFSMRRRKNVRVSFA
jgi:PEP-CTERM motif